MSEVILAAWIEFSATVIAALVGGFLGVRWLNQQRLREQLMETKSDIRFLLEVERIHAEKQNVAHPLTPLREARRITKERDFAWSGKNTKSKVDQYISRS